jgi:chromosomal replication initiator protein
MADAFVPDPAPPTDHAVLRQLLEQLGARVRREQMETWFRSLSVVRTSADEVELSVTSQFVRDWLLRNFLGVIQDSVAATVGGRRRVLLSQRDEDGVDSLRLLESRHLSRGLDTILDPIVQRLDAQAGSGNAGSGSTGSGSAGSGTGGTTQLLPQRSHPVSNKPGPSLNPNYTFDRFVVGPCNRLVHASAIAIGENPGCAYNPLFVHGNVGLGKSHVLQAICHTVLRRDSRLRVVYASCEDFTNSYIQAIQNGQLDAFRDYHRNADLLVIDDVQFLANKEKTQEEFFHTFNALYDAQKQIVLSSDRPPVEIPTIQERLVSRFKWGLVTEVEAPCLQTRTSIVLRKALGRGVEMPIEVARYLAERVATNIRELEGAVIKVVGIAALTEQPITLELAESCMRGMPIRHHQVTVDDVMALITSEFAITIRELTGKGRTQSVSLPRQMAMFLLRQHTESSLEDIGRVFGNRDHTTVLYAVGKIGERSQSDKMFKELLEGLSNRLMTRNFRA